MGTGQVSGAAKKGSGAEISICTKGIGNAMMIGTRSETYDDPGTSAEMTGTMSWTSAVNEIGARTLSGAGNQDGAPFLVPGNR